MVSSTGRRRAFVAVAVALLPVGLVGVSTATAADEIPAAPSFGGTLYLANPDDETDYAVGASLGWNQPVVALPSPGDLEGRLPSPRGTESVVTFIAPQGREADVPSWDASAPWQITPPGLWLADVTPYHQIDPGQGTPSGTNATAIVSGDYSIGVAYLKDDGLHVVPGGLYFIHIRLTGNVDPNKATYTWQPVEATGEPGTSTTPGGGSVASTVPQGLLGFTSSSTPPGAELGGLTIGDSRNEADPGWTLTVSTTADDTRTVVTGASGDTPVAVPDASAMEITLTLVSG